MQLAATMLDAGQIDYALIVDGEGSRYTQAANYRTFERHQHLLAMRSWRTSPPSRWDLEVLRWCWDGPPRTPRDTASLAESLEPRPSTTSCALGDLEGMRTDSRALLEAAVELAVATWSDAATTFDWSDLRPLRHPSGFEGSHRSNHASAANRPGSGPADFPHPRKYRPGLGSLHLGDVCRRSVAR